MSAVKQRVTRNYEKQNKDKNGESKRKRVTHLLLVVSLLEARGADNLSVLELLGGNEI